MSALDDSACGIGGYGIYHAYAVAGYLNLIGDGGDLQSCRRQRHIRIVAHGYAIVKDVACAEFGRIVYHGGRYAVSCRSRTGE